LRKTDWEPDKVSRIAAACLALLPLVSPCAALQLQAAKNIPQLEDSVRRDSNDAQLRYHLAVAYWSRERYDDAGRQLRSAVTIERRFAGAYLALSYLPYARRHQLFKEEAKGRVPPEWRDSLVEADHDRRLAFLINPFVDLEILGAVVPMQEQALAIRGHNVVVLLDPFAAFVRGDYGAAYTIFNARVQERYPGAQRDSVPAALLWFRGLAAGHVAVYDTAIADFRALLASSVTAETTSTAVSPIPLRTNDFRYILATILYRAHRFPEAIALYKEALGNDVGLFMAHVQMGRIYEELKEWPDAVEHFRSAVATSPDDPSLLLDLGIVLREAGNLAASDSTLTAAMAANPRDSRVLYHLGITLQEEGKVPAAQDIFMRFLAMAPARYERQLTDVRQRLATMEH
jgi:tetratricopeptide (TPR) repeat protein